MGRPKVTDGSIGQVKRGTTKDTSTMRTSVRSNPSESIGTETRNINQTDSRIVPFQLPHDQSSGSSSRANETPSPHMLNLEDILAFDIQSNIPRILANFVPDIELAYEKENQILRHFFENLVLKVDANEQSPWEKLILRNCNFELARSCFITLASMHLYHEGDQSNQEMYGVSKHFLEKIKQEIGRITSDSRFQNDVPSSKRVLVLIHVYILHCILDDGISKDCDFYFATFANICKNARILKDIFQQDQMKALVATLSWYDIVATLMSSECRLLACDPVWFGDKNSDVSTIKIMGCPGELFEVLADLCQLKSSSRSGALDVLSFVEKLHDLIPRVVRYREYVVIAEGKELSVRLKCTQCWAIAAYLAIRRLIKMAGATLLQDSELVTLLVREFLDVFLTLDPKNRAVSQLVFPMYLVGCECNEAFKQEWIDLYDGLHVAAHSGALRTLRKAVEQSWNSQDYSWGGDLLLL